jgi:hypothetical protein
MPRRSSIGSRSERQPAVLSLIGHAGLRSAPSADADGVTRLPVLTAHQKSKRPTPGRSVRWRQTPELTHGPRPSRAPPGRVGQSLGRGAGSGRLPAEVQPALRRPGGQPGTGLATAVGGSPARPGLLPQVSPGGRQRPHRAGRLDDPPAAGRAGSARLCRPSGRAPPPPRWSDRRLGRRAGAARDSRAADPVQLRALTAARVEVGTAAPSAAHHDVPLMEHPWRRVPVNSKLYQRRLTESQSR